MRCSATGIRDVRLAITPIDHAAGRVLLVRGELDLANADELSAAVAAARGDGAAVLLDLDGVDFADVIGLRAIERSGADAILRESPAVRRVRELVRSMRRF